MSQLTQEHLKTQFHYDPLTGALSWLVNRGGARAGSTIRTKDKQGYLRVRLHNTTYRQHRLIWCYVTGHMPTLAEDIDHRDTNTSNNVWSNLRLCSKSCNSMNTNIRSDNTSGVKGVSWNAERGNWLAIVTVNGVQHRSRHSDVASAKLAVEARRLKLHGSFANHGRVVPSA